MVARLHVLPFGFQCRSLDIALVSACAPRSSNDGSQYPSDDTGERSRDRKTKAYAELLRKGDSYPLG